VARDKPRKRRTSGSEGFRPIKQVGVAYSIGAPLMVMGMFILLTSFLADDSTLRYLGAGLMLAGMFAGASNRVI
jgi:hypothetical protein